jgi:hypothetical protein
MIWVWLIHGKTSRCSKFINDINKHSHANLYLFVSLLNWNTCVCRNFGKQNIVGTNGIPKFFFFKGSIAILTWGFSRSCLQILWLVILSGMVHMSIFGERVFMYFYVATPLWGKCEDETHTPKKWELGVLRDSRNFRARQQKAKHLALRCSLYCWKVLEV